MTYKYGINADVLPSLAQTPVATGSCLVYVGLAASSDSNVGLPIVCHSYAEYLSKFHNDEAPTTPGTLDLAAQVAFNLVGLDHAFFVNVNEDGMTAITAMDANAYLAAALEQVVLTTSERPNIVCVPDMWKSQQTPETLATLCSGHIAGRYHAVGVVGVPYADNQVSGKTIVAENITKQSNSGYIISCWGAVRSGSVNYPLEMVAAAVYARQDARNTDGVPFRSIGNLPLEFATSYVAITASSYKNLRASEADATAVAKKGILSVCNRGGGQLFTWGDHTSAFSDGGTFDELYRFDSNIRIFIHILNRFIDKWRGIIDAPMTLSQRNDVLNEEQNYLNYLKAIGALIGQPRCAFRAEDNGPDNVAQGYFTFLNISTTCIPVKHLQLNVIWTADGLASYTE